MRGSLRAAQTPDPLAAEIARGQPSRRWPLRSLAFLGPSFVACVAYIDPGNFATNIAGGSRYGYTLLWVVVASNLMAMLIQWLSAKLGIASGRNLAELCRERFPRRVSIGLWLQAEFIAMATDLAEFLGAALGFHLLFGMPLLPAALLTAVTAFGILGLQRFGFRPIEAVIAAIVGVIGTCYAIELFYSRPPFLSAAKHAVVPSFAGSGSVLIAVGILGATVMPHVIYLHSALTQDRIVPRDEREAKSIARHTIPDVVVAMTIAGLINVAMLVMAASVFYAHGDIHVATIEQAHATLHPLLGRAADKLFALALLASGLSSSTVGTMAGQIVMQGFVQRRIPIVLRRGVTMLPALVVIALSVDPSRTLVISQVVLSFGIPFALVPLVAFTAKREIMGSLVNRRLTTAVAAAVASLIVGLNVFLLYKTFAG
ncbi:MAG: Nramp family divalent metal transporter [Gaiellaceae bacterium]